MTMIKPHKIIQLKLLEMGFLGRVGTVSDFEKKKLEIARIGKKSVENSTDFLLFSIFPKKIV